MGLEFRAQRSGGGRVSADDFFGRSFGYEFTSFVSAFRAQLDDPVGGFDEVHIVLDHDDRVAFIGERLQDGDQFVDVMKMKAGRGFVENVDAFFRWRGGRVLWRV